MSDCAFEIVRRRLLLHDNLLCVCKVQNDTRYLKYCGHARPFLCTKPCLLLPFHPRVSEDCNHSYRYSIRVNNGETPKLLDHLVVM